MPEGFFPYRHFDHFARVLCLRATVQTIRRCHRNSADLARFQMFYDLGEDRSRAQFYFEGVINRRHGIAFAKVDVNDRPDNLSNFACFHNDDLPLETSHWQLGFVNNYFHQWLVASF